MIFHGERGTITALEGDQVKITFLTSDACDECGLKVICAPGTNDARVLSLNNSDHFEVGDTVQLEEVSNLELHLATAQFGLPMLLFLLGLFLGYYIPFSIELPRELIAFLFALLGLAISFPLAKGIIARIADLVPQKYLQLKRAD